MTNEYTCPCGKKHPMTAQPFACDVCGAERSLGTEIDQTTEFTPQPGGSVSGGESSEEEAAGPKDYGTHRILREHARGGMGKVSVAVDKNLQREVALKELFAKAAGSRTAVERFLDEAEITAKLEHPGIVPVHAFGLDGDGRPFYTMKFVHGKTLAEAIKSYHAMPDGPEKTAELRELLRRFASVCQTMQFAHTHGILHRDLKPANIMLGEHGETLIMDWGLAKRMAEPEEPTDDTQADPATTELSAQSQHTEAGNVIGTPAYMSPEQASGDSRRLGPASDIYSLGAILYQTLTGQALYTGKSSYEILRKVLNDQPQWPAGGIPKPLEAVARKALAREPAERYPDAAALYRDVMNWLDDEPIAAHPDSRGDSAKRWVRKNTALTVTLFISTLLLLTIIGTACVMLERARTQTVAAQMTAAEMKQKAEAAREKAKQLKADLERKELELEQARAALAAAGDDADERARLQKRVDELTAETSTLREKISHLETFAESVEQPAPEPETEAFSRCVVLNINQMREAGQVTVDAFQPTAGSLRSLMDIHYNSQRGPFAVSATNPAVITLDFAQPQTLTGLTFTYMHPEPGSYEVEIADTAADLERRENTYRLLVPDSPILATGRDFGLNAVQFLRPTELKIIRLTVRSAVPHIHLRGLAILGFPHPSEIADAAPFIESPASNFEVADTGNGNVRITKYIGDELHVVIPRLINGKPVVELGKDSFKDCAIQSVVTPDTLVSIDSHAFHGEKNQLQKIYLSKSVKPWLFGGYFELHTFEVDEENPHLCAVDGVLFTADRKTLLHYPANKEGAEYTTPAGVERIENLAFHHNRHLVSIVVSEGVKEIGRTAHEYHSVFFNCANLVKVSLPESLEYLCRDCFKDCHKLENVTMPEKMSIKKLEQGTFYNCHSLQSITIPQDVEEISYKVFNECNKLKSVTIPEHTKLKIIGKCTFYNCHSLRTFTIPQDVEEIGSEAFNGCHQLESFTIPENAKLKKIIGRAFGDCYSLQTFTVSQDIEEIAPNAFNGCHSLENFYVAAGNQHFSASEGVLFRNGGKILHRYPNAKPEDTYAIPPGVEEISQDAFIGSRFPINLKIPNSMKRIGPAAFNSSQLVTVNIPEGVTRIESHAFANSPVQSLVFPKSLESIGDNLCHSAKQLRSVKFLGPIKELSGNAFGAATSLANIEIPEGLEIIFGAGLADTGLHSITLPKSLKKIDRCGLGWCKSLSEVTILGKDTEINILAFEHTNTKNLTIRAPRGSKAEAFAKENDIKFIPLTAVKGIAPPPPPGG